MNQIETGLRAARERAGLSIDDVAVLIRALPTRIVRWESGLEDPGADALYELSAIYGVPPHRLLTVIDAATGPETQEVAGILPALDAFRRELTAMQQIDLLPLDDETIDYCVGAMRARLTADKPQNE